MWAYVYLADLYFDFIITLNISILCIDFFMYNTVRNYFIFSLNINMLIFAALGTPIIFPNKKKEICICKS